VPDVFSLEPRTPINRNDSFILSYRHILKYFSGLKKISDDDLDRGAHMVYGWMPTILHLHPAEPCISLKGGAEILTKAKSETLTRDEIAYLKCLINNSVVGTSKLLHFVAPNHYAIWDSKVCSFVHGFNNRRRANNVERYLEYLELLKSLMKDSRFKSFHAVVNKECGYHVSALRALELRMFLNAPHQ